MLPRDEDAALQTDAYIEALLATHGGRPVLLPDTGLLPPADLRRAIALLERGLVRVHPSFRFEEQLATRLLAAARRPAGDVLGSAPADVIALPAATDFQEAGIAIDRRLLLGGAALASGVSLAGAAMLAWRRWDRGRSRRSWIA
jgi:hypothetical protein